jgi:hypothetical protein
MIKTVDALKTLHVALGGSADDVKNISLIPDMITAIATVAATASAPELPAVTAADNGSVLKVADGKWAVGTDATE